MASTSYLMMAVSGTVIVIESAKHGWIDAIAKSIVFPCYVILVVFFWTLIGEWFTQGV